MELDLKHRQQPKEGRPNALEWLIAREGYALAEVRETITHEDFVQHCTACLPAREPGKRDFRRTNIVRALRLMIARDRLPFAMTPTHFILQPPQSK